MTNPMAAAKKDYRKKYDEYAQNFIEDLRDDYENWIHKFFQAFSITELCIKNSISARWPLFTGLIGTSYNFGVDWTREHESLIIPEAFINKLVNRWITRLDLDSWRDNEMYPYVKSAIESSIRYGLKKSISDFSKEAIKEGVIDELKKITNQSKEEILANSLNLYYRVVSLPGPDI